MDANAKHWWDHVSQATHQPNSMIIPGEGWSIFLYHRKLATFNNKFLIYMLSINIPGNIGNNLTNLARYTIPLIGLLVVMHRKFFLSSTIVEY